MDMTEPEAIEVARWLAVAQDFHLDSYGDPEARREPNGWAILFKGRSGAPGDHFTVVLDDGTRESRIVLGR